MTIFRSKSIINLVILVTIFLVSIVVRWDNLKDPMGRHHEWLTGHVLSTVSIYEKDGAASHYFAPVWTFSNEVDRFLVSSQPFKDKNNYTYYVSYPPMCFVLPHLIFTVTGTHATVGGIRAINLVVHFLTAFFVFLIVLKIFRRSIGDSIFIPAILGFCLYTFASGNLWFYGHVFFADMLVPLFITSFLYVFLKILYGELTTKKAVVLLFIPCLLGSYTEWQMLFVAFFTSLIFFFKGFKNRKYFVLFATVCVATVLPVLLTFYQYSSIAGSKALIEVVSNKYKQRSGGDSNTAEAGLSMHNSYSFERISEQYETNYAPLLDFGWYCLLIFILLIVFNRMLDKNAIKWNHFFLFTIILLSILLHHYAFFNFTAVHDFSTLKSSLFLSLFGAYVVGLIYVIFDIESVLKRRLFVGVLVMVSFGLFFHFSTRLYYNVNMPNKIDNNPRVIGEIVHRYIKPNEVVFCSVNTSPEATWYAQRNIITAGNTEGAVDLLKIVNSPYNGKLIILEPLSFKVIGVSTEGKIISEFTGNYGNLLCLQSNSK